MRAIGMLLWLVVLGFSLHNWWQIKELKRELEVQRAAAVRVSERSPGVLRKMQVALQRGERARELLESGRYREAEKELDGAMAEFSAAAKASDEATAERLRKVEETFAKVRDQAQGLLRRVTPGGEKSAAGG